jgi:hypothetical protein
MSIEAMKQALEALEAHAEIGINSGKAITSLQKAIAEAEKQEPVAWRNAALRVGEDLCSVGPFGYYDMTAEQWLDWALSVVTVHAPPPQRQPLTDEQIWNLLQWVSHPIEVARVIEDAHGIKGEA